MKQNLFQHARQNQIEQESPLANRMRPRTLEQFVGQGHIIGQGRLLRRAIEADQLSSLIFYGPPGTGKTTLAAIIANQTKSQFITINAVLAGISEIRSAIANAKEERELYNRRTTLFVDEVHRWNKAQQDALLPHVENGTVILIGATTENPYFEVNKALVSRSRIFQLQPLTSDDLRQIAQQALADEERGYGKLNVAIAPAALDHLTDVANGDARGVLNALELAVETTPPNENGVIQIDLAVAEESIQRRAVLYDKDGDAHYDTISAFIKSLRGSDPDAALYWMAKMLYAGEDPRFIFRRMGILASEDVGLADPNAARVVESCWALYERIGLPEGRFHLAQAALYLATCPKSNTTLAFFDALAAVEKEQESDVPNHLRDGNRDSEGFGHGKGYLYPHAYRDHWVAQQYLPALLQGKTFYQPSDQGYEAEIRRAVQRHREAQLAAMLEMEESEPTPIYTTSPANRGREAWLQRAIAQSSVGMAHLRERLFELAKLGRHHLALTLFEMTGLLTWEAARQTPEGGVWVVSASPEAGEALAQMANSLPELERPQIVADLAELPAKMDCILARNPVTARDGEAAGLFAQLREALSPDGRFVFAQTVPRRGQRLVELVDWSGMPATLQKQVAQAEEAIYADESDGLVNWDVADVEAWLTGAGFGQIKLETAVTRQERQLTTAHTERWFGAGDGERGSYAERLAEAGISGEELKMVEGLYCRQLLSQPVLWHTTTLFGRAGL